MWNKKFAYVLNYSQINKAAHKNNPWTQSPQQNEKTYWRQLLISSLYSRKVAETIILKLAS